MADTITRNCKRCEVEFDSIYEIDEGICENCIEKLEQMKENYKFNSIVNIK